MIIILCETFWDAKDAFDLFMEYLNYYAPLEIQRVFEDAFSVETDNDLRYIFIDKRYLKFYEHVKPDVLTVEEFFEYLEDAE